MPHRAAPHRFDIATQLSLIERAALVGGWSLAAPSLEVRWSSGVPGAPELDGPTGLDVALAGMSAEDRDRSRGALQAALGGEPFDVEVQTALGTRAIWLRVIGEPVHDATGAVIAVNGVSQDITDLRDARRFLVQGQELLRQLAEAMPLMVWWAAPDGDLQYANGRLRDYLGEDALARLHDRRSDAVHADDRGRFDAARDDAIRAGAPFTCDVRLRRAADGAYRWHRVAAVPVRDDDGNTTLWFGTGTDIHSLRRSEDEALALSHRLRATLDSITDAFILIDDQWRFAFMNRQAAALLGRPAAGLIGRVIWDEYPAMLGTIFETEYRAAVAAGASTAFEAYYPAPLDRWFSVSVFPSAEGLAVYFRDVTEHHAAEASVREAEARFAAVATAAADVVWDWSLPDDAVTWGEGIARTFGLDAARITTGEAWLDHVHPDDRSAVRDSIGAVIAGAGGEWHHTYRFLRGDGEYATVEDHGVVVTDPAGTPERLVGGMSDITGRLALEEQLRRSQRLEAVGQLVGGVAHDFNNLLTVVIGNTELLAEEIAREDPRHELVRLIHEAASRGAELTHGLLAFARRQALEPQALQVPRALERMGRLLARTLSAEVELTIRADQGIWEAFVDPAQFEAALLNLAINAQDAMAEGGSLIIQADNAHLDQAYADAHPEVTAGPYVCVAVSDTGTGIAPEHRDLVFEPFFTTKEVGHGTGLGLSMVYGFARQSGGHISLDSEPGEGTTVRLYLPRASPGPS